MGLAQLFQTLRVVFGFVELFDMMKNYYFFKGGVVMALFQKSNTIVGNRFTAPFQFLGL